MEVIKFLVDISQENPIGKLIEVEGWLVAGYMLNENQCLYICDGELSLARNLYKTELDIYYTTSPVLLGKTPKNIEDERVYINSFMKKIQFTSISDYLLSESFDKHLQDISADLFLTDGVG